MTSLLPQGLLFFERGWLSSNSILLDDGDSTVLMDSGYVTHSNLLLSLLSSHLQLRSLTHLVNTHLHSDHCGGNNAVQTHYPAVQTLIPYGQFDYVRHWDTDLLSYEDTGQLVRALMLMRHCALGMFMFGRVLNGRCMLRRDTTTTLCSFLTLNTVF
ncbi:MAG: MBL fold metallo-hydrolase [Betaproteobacteria bacterium]|nr:MBL fold metallo-hydrolase [Betaproteobacteria bacterium]